MKNYYRDSGLAISVAALIVILLAMAAHLFFTAREVFWLVAPFIVIAAGFSVGKLITVSRKGFQYRSFINEAIEETTKGSLYTVPLAACIVDEKNGFLWFNKLFREWFPDEAVYGNELSLLTDLTPGQLNEDGVTPVKIKNRHYDVSASAADERFSGVVHVVYFADVTERTHLEYNARITRPVVIIMMIDGYNEMFEFAPESERTNVIVQIDKMLETFFGRTNGIMKKTSHDRIWAVVEQQSVDDMVRNKVSLLDKVRDIAVSDRQNVSLSIGIGTTGKDLAESDAFARQALEMALGRGGDQAAVKTANGFEFYGGVSRGIERQNKVKTRIISNSLIELVNNSDVTFVMGHRFSDLDSVGASVGITAALRGMGKPAYAVVDAGGSLAGELIEHVRAREEDGREKHPPMFIQPAKAREDLTENSLLIIVDTHNPALLEDGELYQEAEKVVVIDHHRKMVGYIADALIFHHEAFASSASEMVTELIQYFGKNARISPTNAEALLAGIMLDTKNFSVKTGVRTFEAAAYLRRLGADTINVKALFANTFDSYKQRIALIASAKLHGRCAIAFTETGGDNMRLIAPQTADEMLSLRGVDASFVIFRTNASEVSISARSYGAVNVQLIMEALGGGGHQGMAGSQLKNVSVGEAVNMLTKAIDAQLTTIDN